MSSEAIDLKKDSFQPSQAVLRVLETMVGALEKNPVRTYGGCIGVRDGFACITDGFAMLQWESPELCGIDTTLARNLYPSNVKFPDWRAAVASGEGVAVDGASILKLIGAYRTPKGAPCFLRIDEKGKSSVVPEVQTTGTHFAPSLIQNFLKGLPKGAKLCSAAIVGDQLQLRFGTGDFLLLVVKVTNPE